MENLNEKHTSWEIANFQEKLKANHRDERKISRIKT